MAFWTCCLREAMAGSGLGAPDRYSRVIRAHPLLSASLTLSWPKSPTRAEICRSIEITSHDTDVGNQIENFLRKKAGQRSQCPAY